MACFTPMKVFRDLSTNTIIFGESQDGTPLYLPCGRCIGCRTDLTKDWAVRCYHESQMHDYNCVLTLTFDEDHLINKVSLEKSDIQNFIKRLRQFIFRDKNFKKKYPSFANRKISYLYCGEYGELLQRPHFHIIIFGFDFPDKEFYKEGKSGDNLYNSEILSKLWPFGFSTIGSMSMSSAMYCASYITKYTSNDEKVSIYTDTVTGEFKTPEFGHASRNPSVGLRWLEKYHRDLMSQDCVIINNQRYRIPRYYIKKLESINPEYHYKLLSSREESLDNVSPDSHDLKNKFTIKMAQVKLNNPDVLKSSSNTKRLKYIREVLSKERL